MPTLTLLVGTAHSSERILCFSPGRGDYCQGCLSGPLIAVLVLEIVGKRVAPRRADTSHIIIALLRVIVPVATLSNVVEIFVPRALKQAVNASIHPTKTRSLDLINFQLQRDIDRRTPGSPSERQPNTTGIYVGELRRESQIRYVTVGG